jgi:hypothetical protein
VSEADLATIANERTTHMICYNKLEAGFSALQGYAKITAGNYRNDVGEDGSGMEREETRRQARRGGYET